LFYLYFAFITVVSVFLQVTRLDDVRAVVTADFSDDKDSYKEPAVKAVVSRLVAVRYIVKLVFNCTATA